MDHFSAVHLVREEREDAAHLMVKALAFDGIRQRRVLLNVEEDAAIAYFEVAQLSVENKVVVDVGGAYVTERLARGLQQAVLDVEGLLIARRAVKEGLPFLSVSIFRGPCR
jgi:hypothetical protein